MENITAIGSISLRDPFGATRRAQRSLGLRAHTDFPVLICDGVSASHCRAVELSSTGIVLERRRSSRPTDTLGVVRLELFLPGLARPISALARSIRWAETRQAMKLIAVSDADRLTLTEHLDRQFQKGLPPA